MIPKIFLEIINYVLVSLNHKVSMFKLVQISLLVLSYFRYDTRNDDAYVKDTKTILREYDFIVIGAGSAGAVVANRLSEVRSWNVLLLEAGGNENEINEFPALFFYQLGSSIDWHYRTTPKPQSQYCQAMVNHQCNWARGKILGGTSNINAMLYVRGNKNDFENWESLGNPGWSYEDVLPYFLKSEDQRNPKYLQSRYHRRGGYLTVQEARYKTPLADAFLEGGRELGYQVHDINGEYQTGFMQSQATYRDGGRCSTARAFLRPLRKRTNLHISMNSHVTKILIDPATKMAQGVQFIKGKQTYTVRATKEVILSAGAISSPQILMLSGVGPQEHLQDHKIPVVQDLRVGDNLQDHYGLGGMSFTVTKPVTVFPERLLNVSIMLEYISKKRGPISGLMGEVVAFLNTKYANKSLDWPDIQFDYAPVGMNTDKDQMMRITNVRRDFLAKLYDPMGSQESFVVIPNIMRPKSRGKIRLVTSNPYDHPDIDPNYYGHPDDMKVLIEGIRMARKLGETRSFGRYGTKFYTVPFPGCDHMVYDSDGYWECGLRHMTFTLWHFSGTCKMGPRADPGAVVDARLRVYGIKGLRIIDASVMPTITTGNINAPVIMMGEKGSDYIKQDWKRI